MNGAEQGIIFNIQRFSLDDGQGIRTCVFFKGCPLRCRWCHNAESQRFEREIAYDAKRCIGCGSCAEACPQKCHVLTDEGHMFLRRDCIACGACAEACPTLALECMGKPMRTDEVMRVVRRDRLFYGKDGGITLTGGEPMAQYEFAMSLAKCAKAEGLSVVMETSGFAPTEHYRAIAPWIDCFYYDCKADAELHRALIGADDTLILENLRVLSELHANIVLRCPIIPNGNLTEAYTEKIIRIANTFRIQSVSLLPYHKIGSEKSSQLGKEAQTVYTVPTHAEMDALREKIRMRVSVPVR